MAPADQPTFSFDTVAVLISAMLANGQTIGTSTYEAMSALDGKRSANAFSHQFRAVIRRARELKDTARDELQPATPKPRVKAEDKKGSAKSVKGKKRGAADIHVDSGESGIDADSPNKKAKTEEVDIDAAME